MEKKIERVELVVLNKLGVLGRVAGHIRHEGWNIKRLSVDENDGSQDESEAGTSSGTSLMEIDIEGTHTKLAQVMERILNLDCVKSIAMIQNGEKVVRQRPQQRIINPAPSEEILKAPAKKENTFRILAINPGSTSTKFGLYDDELCIFSKTIRHDASVLAGCGSILNQKGLRRDCIMKSLEECGAEIGSIDAIAGRGGLLKPLESGVYAINEKMLEDLHSATAAVHASALGAIIASEIAAALERRERPVKAYVVDPIVVDEMDRNAKLTGIPGIERSSVFHALNQKAIAKRLAARMDKPYENARFIVAHLGGGITVGAHRYGRVIDVNDALAGEGPFTPERTGAVPLVPVINMCFSGEYTREEMMEKVNKNGGMKAYLGTSEVIDALKMINDGDEFAALVLDSMAYQVSKEIGAMAAVLEGVIDAIILTGGLAYSNRFTGAIKQRVDKLAPVHVFPGEDEMLALASGVLRVLRGTENPAHYG
ncbi:MAG: butyrate kinase [Treponema sp.]|jgi:butyrate kinase|nr:butyrate kinase [Treponema sp.]